MEVRRAEVADADAMAAVAEEAWWSAYAGFLDADTVRRVVAEHYTADRLAAAADEEDVAAFVAGDDVVGFAVAERTWTDTVDLHMLYVHPDRWGEGAGSALLDAVEAWARERDADYLRAAAFADNHAGRPFFEAAGFEHRRTRTTEVFDEAHEEHVFEREV